MKNNQKNKKNKLKNHQKKMINKINKKSLKRKVYVFLKKI